MALQAKFLRVLFTCFALTLLFHSQATGANIYVAPGGSGDGSIATPTDLQSALDAARVNGADDVIYLQQGTYDASTAGAATFVYGTTSNDNMAVTLLGGWDTSFTTQSTDPALTMLDGGNNSPVLHILADATGVSYNFTLETLTIQNGNASSSNGAGIYAYTGVVGTSGALNLTVRNCLFQNNTAAVATYNGGGIFSNAYVEVYDSTFSSNTAKSGAGIWFNDVPGGDQSLSPLVQNSTFDGNSTVGGWQGTAIFNYVSLRVKASTFTNNTGSGSTIYSHTNSPLDISNSVFYGNKIFYWGSALSFWDASGTVTNCLFYDNQAGYTTNNGYGTVTSYNPSYATKLATINILNSTFVGNQAAGTGLAAIHNRLSSMNIYNSIFWNNEGVAGIYRESGAATISYSDVQNLTYYGFTDGGNNINNDPLFVNTAGLSSTWDLRLQATPTLSPAIDVGNNAAPGLATVDLDNNGRIKDGNQDGTATVDLGAYEYIVYHTLTYNIGANGSSITGTTPQTVEHTTNGTAVTAVPNTGYHFTQWDDGVADNPRTDTNVTADITVTAEYAINTYTLTYNQGTNGTISGTTPQTVDYNTGGTAVTAVANTGYHFVQWDDGVAANPRTDTNVTADITVTAEYAIDTYTLTYNDGTDGSITGTTPQTVNHGANGTAVTAVANTGYHFVQWDDGVADNPRTDTSVTADITVTAEYAINTYTLTYNQGTNGTISGTTPQTVDHGADGTAVTAVPSTGYYFVQWDDGVAANPRTDTNVTADITVTAEFAIYTYTLTYNAGTDGSITGTTPQTVNHGSSGSAVLAVANTGYHFVEWSDKSTDNPRTDTNVTADITVTATYTINTYTLSYTAGANGYISGKIPPYVNHGTDGPAVTAIADTGYHFSRWSDGVTDNPRTDTNITADISVTAIFKSDFTWNLFLPAIISNSGK